MTSPLEAYLRDNPQLREGDRQKLIDDLYQTSGIEAPREEFVEKLLRDPQNPLGHRVSGNPDKGRDLAPVEKGIIRGVTSGIGGALETLQQVPDWMGIPRDPPEKDWSPGAIGKRIKESGPKIDPKNNSEWWQSMGGYLLGSVPTAIAEWQAGVPYWVMKGAHTAEELAKEKGPNRKTTGIEVPPIIQSGAEELGFTVPKRFGESFVTYMTPQSWHKIPEGGGATTWEKFRDAIFEGSARAYMGWVIKSLAPQRWMQQSFHFAGAQGVTDLAEGKGYDEQALNFGLAFIMSAAAAKLSPDVRMRLDLAKELAEKGDGAGAMRHLDEILKDPKNMQTIAEAARTRDLSPPVVQHQLKVEQEIAGIEKELASLDRQIAGAKDERVKADLENKVFDLTQKAHDLYWMREPSFVPLDYQPKNYMQPVGATERLDRWEAMKRSEATYASAIARKQERDARLYAVGEEGELLFKGVPSEQRKQMMSAWMRGSPESVPEPYRAFFERMSRMNDAAYRGEQASEILYEYRDNYWHLQWMPKDHAAASKPSMAVVGRPGFSKEKMFDDVFEGEAAGFSLKTDNPAVLAIWRLEASNAARARVDAMRWTVEDGLAVPKGSMAWEKAPAGAGPNWRPQRPDIYQDWQEIKVGGKDYWMHPDALKYYERAFHMDKLFLTDFLNLDKNGYVMRSARGLGAAWMALRNTTIPMKLSFSGFHGKHVVDIMMANQVSPVVTAALNKHITFDDFMKGIKDANMIGSYAYGARLRENFKKPNDQLSPIEQTEKEILLLGGFNPAQPDIYQIRAERAWRRVTNDELPKYYQELEKGGADQLAAAWGIGKGHAKEIGLNIGRMIERVQEPLFADWIPAVKNSAYMNEAKNLLNSKPDLLTGTPEANNQLRQQLTQVRKNIDDRFGEMQYEKWLVPNVLKRALIGSMLSVGWNFGALRSIGGAALDTARIEMRGASVKGLDEMSEITNRMVYVGMYGGLSLLQGSIMTLVNAGRVEGVKDMMYPVQSDGKRVNTPFLTRVLGELYYHTKNEGMAGGIERLLASKLNAPASGVLYGLHNRDYFDRQIYDPTANPFTQVAQFAKWYVPHMVQPISYSSTIGQDVIEPGKVAMGLWGFAPAPRYIEYTPMQSEIYNQFKQIHPMFVTPFSERAKSDDRFQMNKAYRKALESKKPEDVQAYDKLRSNYIDKYEPRDRGASITRAENRWGTQIPMAYQFSQLPDKMQQYLLDKMTKDERVAYVGFAHAKVRDNYPRELYEHEKKYPKLGGNQRGRISTGAPAHKTPKAMQNYFDKKFGGEPQAPEPKTDFQRKLDEMYGPPDAPPQR